MSYFNGISDNELLEEGWSMEQIKELRRVERAHIEKVIRKKEEDYLANMQALNEDGSKTYAMLISGPHAQDKYFAAWAARGSQEAIGRSREARMAAEELVRIEREIRVANRRWWQFWIR